MLWKKNTQATPRPTQPIDYPTGVAVNTEKGTYFIKGKMRYKFASIRAFESWRLAALPGSTKSISGFRYAGVLGFRDGTIIKNFADNKVYLISGNKKRHIQSPDVFDKFGFSKDDVLYVSNEETLIHDDGEVLT